jgi:hypothetical protein
MTETTAALRDAWKRLRILNSTGASDNEIAQFEARYRVTLPPIVREYFSVLNGTEVGQCGMEDEDLISFWHLDQVRTLAEECPGEGTPHADQLFVFADWSIWAYAWAVRLSADTAAATPVVITHEPGQQVAASFGEFIQRYVARDPEVLFPDRARPDSRQ